MVPLETVTVVEISVMDHVPAGEAIAMVRLVEVATIMAIAIVEVHSAEETVAAHSAEGIAAETSEEASVAEELSAVVVAVAVAVSAVVAAVAVVVSAMVAAIAAVVEAAARSAVVVRIRTSAFIIRCTSCILQPA